MIQNKYQLQLPACLFLSYAQFYYRKDYTMLTNTNSQNLPTHKGWIDLIKVIAAFMVLFQHSASPLWTSAAPNTLLWKSIHIPFIFSRIAVLLFFMCSGSTMLQKERRISIILKKNILQLLKVYFFWMLIYQCHSPPPA